MDELRGFQAPKGEGTVEKKVSAEKAVREIRRKTRRRFSAEEKIRIVIERLRGKRAPPRCAAAKPSLQADGQLKLRSSHVR
jgi:hypothetical protein